MDDLLGSQRYAFANIINSNRIVFVVKGNDSRLVVCNRLLETGYLDKMAGHLQGIRSNRRRISELAELEPVRSIED